MRWVGAWACALYYGDDTGDEGKASALRISKTLANSTLRQIIRMSIGGDKLRFTFSNEYGQTNLMLRAVKIAKATVPGQSDIDTNTTASVLFDGESTVIIPAGKTVTSDTVEFSTAALERIAVSVYFGDVPECLACHVGARANSFVCSGDVTSAEKLDGAQVNTHWFALSGIDVCQGDGSFATQHPFSVIILGDSITDGYGVTDEQYTRWTDFFAERLQSNCDTRHISVINMGIGTNKLFDQINPAAASERFERDVLSRPGVGIFVFLIGVNDLLVSKCKADDIINGYEIMINKAKVKGIKTIGCTILPYAQKDIRRHKINNWLREQVNSGSIDALFDFDELLKDPKVADRMKPEFDSDGIHPSIAAYKAMGEYASSVRYVNNCYKDIAFSNAKSYSNLI